MEVHDESTLNNIFIESGNHSAVDGVQEYWAMHFHADMTNISFTLWTLISFQKSSIKEKASGNLGALSKPLTKCNW